MKKPEPEPVVDLLDMGNSSAAKPEAEKKQEFAFDFMSGGQNNAPVPQKTENLLDFGGPSQPSQPA